MLIHHFKIAVYIFALLIIGKIAYCQNCFNSDFETGDVDGYDTYIGHINSDGSLEINTQTLDPDRHKLVSILDGYDEIAFEYCEENKYLPVVPPAGGIYAMRLGNSDNGAESERILLSFTVTNENSFFLLRYAVLLNDPSHMHFEQPRFRLSITDQNGDEYPCGRYEVVAAPNLENFENCQENWKVRPWTNIGIELLSYLGEEIIIEMVTTDCALGGHAGYAYLDATCRPLEIELFNNCTDTSTAIMRVTPGFDMYQWSTGHTTSEIEIPNPVVGDIYYVTVTSATGCQLILHDTIPPFEVAVPPLFGPPTTNNYCADTTFWFTPSGTNLQQIYSITHQAFVDSIFVNTLISNEYTFVAFSDAGCAFDTVTHFFGGIPQVLGEVQGLQCHNSNDGSINLTPLGNATDFNYQWSNGAQGESLDSLSAGNYSVVISDPLGCSITENYTVENPDPFQATFDVYETLCTNDFAHAEILVTGGTEPFLYSYNLGGSYSSSSHHQQYELGDNYVIVFDQNECRDTFNLVIDPVSIPFVDEVELLIDSCENVNSSIQVTNVINGVPPYEYSINNSVPSSFNWFGTLTSGTYHLAVTDSNGCVGTTVVEIPHLTPLAITGVELVHTSCGNDNGSVRILSNELIGVRFSIDNSALQNNNQFNGLSAGFYTAFAENDIGCQDSFTFTIDDSSSPRFDMINVDLLPCSDGINDVRVDVSQGTEPYEYILDNELSQSSAEFEFVSDGWHTITVIDLNDCESVENFYVEPVDSFTYDIQALQNPDCGEGNGSIVINLTGGKGERMIEYDGDLYPDLHEFDDLEDGLYAFQLRDQADCTYDVEIELLADCKVYVANIFSPNGDENNDLFTINIAQNATAQLTRLNIFDRWGNRVFSESSTLLSESNVIGWDGVFKNKECPEGVYVYELELEMYNGQVIQKDGSFVLMR